MYVRDLAIIAGLRRSPFRHRRTLLHETVRFQNMFELQRERAVGHLFDAKIGDTSVTANGALGQKGHDLKIKS